MIVQETKHLLVRLSEQYESADFIVGDPSWWMHQVNGDANREAMAFVASVLSYGSRKQFMPKIESLLRLADGDMDKWIRGGYYRAHFSPGDETCFYRLYDNSAMCLFFDAYSHLMSRYETLGKYVAKYAASGFDAVSTICQYFSTEGVRVIIPKDVTSACKRVCMFLRWMVRSNSPVDIGLWSDFIDRRTLIMPLDTHVLQQSVRLGLLNSRSASMSAAQRLSFAMLEVFPDDPLRGDFALFGYGVNSNP